MRLNRFSVRKMDNMDDGQALSGKQSGSKYPNAFTASWNSVSNTVGPYVNTIESNYPPKVKKEGLVIGKDRVVRGKMKRKKKLVDGI